MVKSTWKLSNIANYFPQKTTLNICAELLDIQDLDKPIRWS